MPRHSTMPRRFSQHLTATPRPASASASASPSAISNFKFLFLLFSALLLSGCYTAPNPSALPDDFALAITVQVPEAQADAWLVDRTSQPRSLRPARYILEPDEVLRVDVGPGVNPGTYPRLFRRNLNDAQLDSVWAHVRDSGWLTAHHGADPAAAHNAFVNTTTPPPVAEPTAMIYLCANGHRTYFVAPLESSADGPTARELIDTLADLAWITE